jgi:hypothetical protein
MPEGYKFLHILSAEGGHSPLNAHISAEEYEASRAKVLDALRKSRPPIPLDQTDREAMLGMAIRMLQWVKR